MINKDYTIIARAIRNAKTVFGEAPSRGEEYKEAKGIKQIVKELVHELTLDNKKFNPEVFAQACGYKLGEVEFYNK